MEVDDGQRAESGVAVCLRDLGNGQSVLIFDDVVLRSGSKAPMTWCQRSFFTSTTYESNALHSDGELSDEEFKKIGMAVVFRLLAANGRNK